MIVKIRTIGRNPTPGKQPDQRALSFSSKPSTGETERKIRNGRVVFGNAVRDIMLPERETYAFDFSRYKHITSAFGVEKITCRSSKSERMAALPGSAHCREEEKFWNRVRGFETGHSSDEATNEYRFVPTQFDVLKGATRYFGHRDLSNILAQLGLSDLTPFFSPQTFGLESTGEKIQMEVGEMRFNEGRSATFEPTILLDGKPYILEVKGVNFGNEPIALGNNFHEGGECAGGLPLARMAHSAEMLKHLNAHGYDSVVLISAYGIPELQQFDGQALGAYVRAVKSSPPVSHFHENLPEVAEALSMPPIELAEYIIRSAAKDLAIMWGVGITHNWVHEQNIRIGGVSDLTGAKWVRESGFKGVVTDSEMLVASCQKIMRRLVGPQVKYPSPDLFESDPAEAERLETLAENARHENQTADYFRTREIITGELNSRLGLRLSSDIGTTSLAAEIYDMQRQQGFTDPKEVIRVEHVINQKTRVSMTLESLKVTHP